MTEKTLISPEYKEQNRLLHESPKKYGQRGHRHLGRVKEILKKYDCVTILDYGAGSGELSKRSNLPVTNYDPAIPEYDKDPKACDLIVCTDMMEHAEPQYLENILEHISGLTKKIAYFVIATRPDTSKTLPDGSNPHKIVRPAEWWFKKLSGYFQIDRYEKKEGEVYIECTK